MDKNSPKKLKDIKLHSSLEYQELEEMVEDDDEIRKHKLEIEMIKRDQQKQLEKYLKNEIGNHPSS